MARLTRVYQKVFASNASNNGVFGSLQAGNPTTSNNVATLQSLAAFENGWDDAAYSGDKLPPLEEFQGIQYGISYQQAYMLQEGIAEWESNTPYYKGSLAKTISGTSFKLYCSLTDNNVNHAVTNTTYWKLVMDSDNLYANESMSNLNSTGKNIANWSTNTSNCITEIPQDINLTLSSGTLTLKAGSKVYVPNGSGVFNTLTISNDISITTTGSATATGFLYVQSDGSRLVQAVANVSGSTAPSDGIFYDTTNNIIKFYSSGTALTGNYSFPIAIIHRTSGSWDSIDQVFNGFGYIGSTVFALPGVKGLIPDGRNADGTLKSTSFTLPSVKALTETGTNNYTFITNGTNIGNSTVRRYDEALNRIVNTANNTFAGECIIGSFTRTSGVISNFNIKTPFHAVDYYDAAKVNTNNTFTGTNDFKGTTTALTPASATDNSTNVATTAWIDNARQNGNGFGIPNYSAGVSVSNNTDTLATSNGIVCYITKSSDYLNLTITIDSATILSGYGDAGVFGYSGMFIVKKGQTYNVNSARGLSSCTFYPCL